MANGIRLKQIYLRYVSGGQHPHLVIIKIKCTGEVFWLMQRGITDIGPDFGINCLCIHRGVLGE